MKKKLILTLNALLTLALFAGSINAINPVEEVIMVGEKGLENAVDNTEVKAVELINENSERLASIVDDLETGILGLPEDESKQLAAMQSQAQAGQLTVKNLKILKPSTLVAILTALGLITSGGVIAGYLLREKTEPQSAPYNYKYLPQ